MSDNKKMKYCVNCRKVASALGLEGMTMCIAAGHEFIEVTFEDLYHSAIRKTEAKNKKRDKL